MADLADLLLRHVILVGRLNVQSTTGLLTTSTSAESTYAAEALTEMVTLLNCKCTSYGYYCDFGDSASSASCCCVGTHCISGEPPVYISTTLLVSTEVSAVPAEVVIAKTSVEDSPVAVAVVLRECRGLR